MDGTGHGRHHGDGSSRPKTKPPTADERDAVPMIQVDVTDNGPGMPADVMDRIFSPFFTTKPQGSGLGLAIVRKIVDAHDGRIDVERAARRRHALPRDAAGQRQSRAVR